jgi:(1->4)-alpha-D-glucan 1-alpha-D-glucosylmutase
MGLMLDFVPNHMGIGNHNMWWMDVLENGPSSLYAPFFDIDWQPLSSANNPGVLLPMLGDHYGRVLEAGELKLRYDGGAFYLDYYDAVLPVNPRTYPHVLLPMLPELEIDLGPEHDSVLELQSICTGLDHLPTRFETRRAKVIERRREKEILKRRLAALVNDEPRVAQALHTSVVRMNGRPGDARSFDALDRLLEDQAYRVSYWRVAAEEINYRRFFDINELAAIHIERADVFAEAHRLLFELLDQGRVTALRIDHPDGLWDPPGYFRTLQRAWFLRCCQRRVAELRPSSMGITRTATIDPFERMRPLLAEGYDRIAAEQPDSLLRKPLYIVGEKILSRGEPLPTDWSIHGTSGYEFAVLLGGVFVDPAGEGALTEIYERFIGQRSDLEALVYESKKLILRVSMASELNVLAHALDRLSARDRHSRDFTLGAITAALREVIACFPVYRTYVNERTETLAEHDRVAVTRAIRLARRKNPTMDASIFAFLRAIFMLEGPSTVSAEDRESLRAFVMKVQQLTGPVMAKGLEDTAFYLYNRLVSLNEVGGEPERFGRTLAELHRANSERLERWPHSLLTSSTHDTKRSEDVRARISVLSEVPDSWSATLASMAAGTSAYRTELEGRTAPDRNEEYLFYQTLLGTWPDAARDDVAPATPPAEYVERMVAYMRKATKEAKANTSWIQDDPEYDAAVEAYVRGALSADARLGERLLPLAQIVAFHGMWSSLSQALLRFTSPGVPDIYQGTELWDDSLVDPDNRRPVDYVPRIATLRQLKSRRAEGVALAKELVSNAPDGRIKLFVTMVALDTRRQHFELFASGGYRPLETRGPKASHVVAFSRHTAQAEMVVVAPRLTAVMAAGGRVEPLGAAWGETALRYAAAVPGTTRLVDAFTGLEVAVSEGAEGCVLRVADLLSCFPVALLEAKTT